MTYMLHTSHISQATASVKLKKIQRDSRDTNRCYIEYRK